MAKLIINPTSSSRREVPLGRMLLSIGRDPSNDLVLPDALVSRRHAVIECRGDQYVLRDCNSSNGSLVNGDRVAEHPLKDGDLLAIGTSRLLFRGTVEVEDPAAKVVPHPSAPKLACPSCRTDYRRGDAYCRQCGAALPPPAPVQATCSSCGATVPLPARFCSACGTALPRAEGGEPTRPRPLPAASEIAKSDAETEPPAAAPAPEAPPSALPTIPPPVPDRDDLEMRAPEGAAGVPASVSQVALQRSRPLRAPAPTPMPSRRPVVASRPPEPAAALSAPAGARIAAFLMDTILVSVGQGLLVSFAAFYFYRSIGTDRTLPADPGFLPIFLSVALVVCATILGAGYYVYFWGVHGATPGKRAMGLVVQGIDGSMPIGVGRAFLRLLGYILSGALLGVGFVMALVTGLGLHDRLASTRVVRARERA